MTGQQPQETLVQERQQDEARLMHAARGDISRFAPLYERYFPRIYVYCLRRVENKVAAEDLTSQIFARALAGIGNYAGGSVAAWLFRIAHNAVANHYRSRRAHVSLESTDFDAPNDEDEPIVHLIEAETHQAIHALVVALPHEQQELLALKIAGGLSAEEIGQVIGKSAGAVRVELHRIIKRLRKDYEGSQE